MTGAVGMLKDVVRAANAVQDPAGRLQFTDDVRTLHCVYHTHYKELTSTSVPSGHECAAALPSAALGDGVRRQGGGPPCGGLRGLASREISVQIVDGEAGLVVLHVGAS